MSQSLAGAIFCCRRVCINHRNLGSVGSEGGKAARGGGDSTFVLGVALCFANPPGIVEERYCIRLRLLRILERSCVPHTTRESVVAPMMIVTTRRFDISSVTAFRLGGVF